MRDRRPSLRCRCRLLHRRRTLMEAAQRLRHRERHSDLQAAHPRNLPRGRLKPKVEGERRRNPSRNLYRTMMLCVRCLRVRPRPMVAGESRPSHCQQKVI